MPYGSFETLSVVGPESGTLHVQLSRPDQLNAMNRRFWLEIKELFLEVSLDPEVRAIVLSAQGKAFSAGLDLMDFMPTASETDCGRQTLRNRTMILAMQESFTVIEQCSQPVIAVCHGAVVGGAVDLICSCCIRYASSDAWFSIKEVDVGMAADIGTLQRLPKIVGNESLVRELAFTSRRFQAAEAKQLGLVTRIFDSKADAEAGALALAAEIAQKSPLAIVGTKRVLTHARDHTVQEGLDYVATWNSVMSQAPDPVRASTASIQKKTAEFSKL